jgi:hypothetical protein
MAASREGNPLLGLELPGTRSEPASGRGLLQIFRGRIATDLGRYQLRLRGA